MSHRIKRKTMWRKQVMGTPLPIKPVTRQEAYVQSDGNAKFDVFLSVIYIIKTALLFLQKQYI